VEEVKEIEEVKEMRGGFGSVDFSLRDLDASPATINPRRLKSTLLKPPGGGDSEDSCQVFREDDIDPFECGKQARYFLS
jgi:hypothetical protein